MAKEIERKFLVKDQSWREAAVGVFYKQGYLASNDESTVRVRIKGDQGVLTVKGKTKGLTRLEYEYDIPRNEADEMLEQLCGKPIIEKTRYKIPFEGFTWEVDIFHGANDGLVLAEVEMEDESQQPALPAWIGEEVSHDKRYFNAYLAKNPYKSW